MAALADLGEEGLLELIFQRLPRGQGAAVGAGDDAAVLDAPEAGAQVLFKTDTVVCGAHFTPETPPELAGRKALARVVSDMAAMAGEPRQALVSLALPPETDSAWVCGLYDGMRRLAEEFGIGICGGELSSTTGPAVVTVAMTGVLPKGRAVLRSGGRPGDALFVTGELGGTLAGHHLTFQPRVREARWLVEHARPSAMMDLSDGLGADLPRLARASKTGFRAEMAALPCRAGCGPEQALRDGEDFELLFAVPPERVAGLAGWGEAFPGVRLTRIGELVSAEEGFSFEPCGYDHFAKR